MMKLFLVLLFLSMAVMTVMVVQTVRQEMNMRQLKTRTLEDTSELKRKEESIVIVKNKIKDLKTNMDSITKNMGALQKKKMDSDHSSGELDKTLQACNADKVKAEKNKVDLVASLEKLKGDYEQEKMKAQEEIQSLKQQILDRDRGVCAFADLSVVEAQKLCGLPPAPQ